ncbi:hypothetical protein [Paenibacillus illinoisensis]|uniref:von Willebrand factor type A n=1 Tax=Paenibacillus illinoisensis TaxID=59845 RepID=A0A2W0CBN0_9BACL|nr:hypothetical protein [Paenibacillus illinoisensis]PYY29577.1 von Willebrand factor type A [Paenibacillus illinoisensis]
MELLKKMYEEIVESQDAKRYLLKEEEIDHLFDKLQSMVDTPYNSKELSLLNDLSVLNSTVQSLMEKGLNRIQKSHEMSPVVSKHYEQTLYEESYFFDKKH